MDAATISAVPYIGASKTVRPMMFPITRNSSPKVQAAAATIKYLDKRSLNVMIDNFVPYFNCRLLNRRLKITKKYRPKTMKFGSRPVNFE